MSKWNKEGKEIFAGLRPGLTDKIAEEGGTPEFSLEATQGTITEEHDVRNDPDSNDAYRRLAKNLMEITGVEAVMDAVDTSAPEIGKH